MPKDLNYYSFCGISGAISCSTTHALVTPIDLVKCRLQTSPRSLKHMYSPVWNGWSTVWKEGRSKELYRGWKPTFVGYGLQGYFKFGIYEYLKDNMMEKTQISKDIAYIASAASAEVVGDIFLCPFETMKIQIQTSKTLGGDIYPGFFRIRGKEFKALTTLMGRQVPYTICKFLCFEKCVNMLYKTMKITKSETNIVNQLGISFTAGYMSGIACGIISHPADVLISHIGSAGTNASSAKQLLKQLPLKSYTVGIVPRILMIGTLTGLQWLSYDSLKKSFGLETSGDSH